MDADDLLSRPISRRAVVTGMGVGGLALVLGGIGVVEAHTARPSRIAGAQFHGRPLDPPGTVVYTYRGHHGGVNTAVWSPSSARVASGASDKTVQIWGATTGNDVLVYRQHVGAVNAIAWSPTGVAVASASDDATVHVWDATTGHQLVMFRGHTRAVKSVDWSPDATRIVSAGDDGAAHIWDASTGRPILTYRPRLGAVYSAVWWPHGNHIVSAGQSGTVHLWNASTGKTEFVFQRHGAAIEQARWSPSGTYVAASSMGEHVVRVWDANTKRLVYTYRGQPHGVVALAWSPDSTHIASAGRDGLVDVWNATTGAHAFNFQLPHRTTSATPTASGSPSHLVGGTTADQLPSGGTASGTLALRQQPTREGVLFDGGGSATKTVDWSRDGNSCCSGDSGGTVTVTASGQRW